MSLSQNSIMMNLYLPTGGLGRGRVWRSQQWVAGQPSKPWLGTLNFGSSASVGVGRPPSGGCGSCPWAAGNDLPYIQQRFMSDSSDPYSLGDFALPLSTSPSSGDQQQQQQQHRPLTSSPVTADEVFDDFKQHNRSFEVSRSPYVMHDYMLALITDC